MGAADEKSTIYGPCQIFRSIMVNWNRFFFFLPFVIFLKHMCMCTRVCNNMINICMCIVLTPSQSGVYLQIFIRSIIITVHKVAHTNSTIFLKNVLHSSFKTVEASF